MAKTKTEKVAKVQKTRVTLVGNVDLDVVSKALLAIPGLEFKVWKKRGRSVSKKTVESSDVVASDDSQVSA